MIEELRRTGNKAALSSLKFAAEALKAQNEKIEALLHVARAADAMIEKDAIYLGEASDLVEKLVEALKEVEHLL